MGNVVAACVILNPKKPILGLNDSKKLSEKKRLQLEPVIREQARAYGIGQCTPQEIDEYNILQASLMAMRRAYENMQLPCDLMLCDGNQIPPHMTVRCEAVVRGDQRVPEIAAASILAKVERDRQMYELDLTHPEYGFARHKGYPTAEHLRLLSQLPLLDCYRRSFGPVQRISAARAEEIAK